MLERVKELSSLKNYIELKKYLIQLSIYFWTCLKYEHQDLYNECLEKY